MTSGTDGEIPAFDATGAPAFVATGNSGEVLTSNGVGTAPTFQAAPGGGNVSNTGTPVDNQLAVWTNATTIEGTADFTFDGADFLVYNAVNDGNPEIRLGATDLEELNVQTVFDAVAQTLDFVLFNTSAASVTADKGEYRFQVDDALVATIDDGGIELADAKSYFIDTSEVLSEIALGSSVLASSLTSVGTLGTLTVDDITLNANTISSAGASSLAITPTAGQAILLDGTISIDAGVVTGATSIASTTFVGALTGTASGNLVNVVEDTTPQLGGALDGQGFDLNNLGVIFLTEQAEAEVDVAGKGQLWVDLATPNVLMFTDDAGTDFTLAHNATATLNSLTSATSLAWTGMSTGTDGEIPTFSATGAPAFVATGSSGEVLTSNGVGTAPTFQAPTGGGNVSNVGTPLDNQLAVWTGATTVEGTADFTFDGADFLVYNAVNDGNPEIRLGATDLEELNVQTVFDAVAQTLDFVLFNTSAASVTADKGEYRFQVDDALVATIDDGGIELADAKSYFIDTSEVLSEIALGSSVLASSLTSVGTLGTLTVDDITLNANTISSAGASSLAITPTAGQAILLDGTISIDAGVVTGATSIASTTFVGALTGTASGNLVNVVEDTTPQLGGALDGQGFDLNNLGVIFLTEQAEAEVDVAGKGQLWVDLATPNVLMFTDEAGTDFTLAHNATATLNSLTSATSLAWTGMSTGTDGEIPTFSATGAPAFVATGSSGEVLTSNGVGTAPTFQAPTGGGNVSNVGTPLDNQLAVWTGATTVEGTADFTFDGADFLVYNAVNDGNPEIRLGATDLEELNVQTVFDAVAQTLDFVLFNTSAASVTADKGEYRFQVDDALVATIDDGGIELADAKSYFIDTSNVLSETVLGSTVLASSLTSVGILAALDVDNININLNTISSTAGTDLLITPLAGQQIVLDGAIVIDAGEVTGATSITSTTFVGALTGTASGNLVNVVEDTTPQLGGALDGQGFDLNNMGVLFLTEQAAAEVDVAGKGQLWVETLTPNILRFTDDAGTDFTIAHNATATLNSLTSATSLAWTGMSTGTDGQIPTFDATGAPAFVATGNSGEVLTSNGVGTAPTFQAAPGGGNVSNTGTPVDNQLAVWTNATTIEGTADFTFDGADFLIYNAVNDGNPEIRLGATDLEELNVQTVFDAVAQTLDYVLFNTSAASVTADKREKPL